MVARILMDEIIELHDSDISGLERNKSNITICFSGAYLYTEGKGWSQPAKLNLENAKIIKEPSTYPVCISEGELDMGEMKYFNLLELPFSKPGYCTVKLLFTNGEELELNGSNPCVELFGEKKYIEDVEQP
jgi:hypothetical protein